jgi:hypothetical protein
MHRFGVDIGNEFNRPGKGVWAPFPAFFCSILVQCQNCAVSAGTFMAAVGEKIFFLAAGAHSCYLNVPA